MDAEWFLTGYCIHANFELLYKGITAKKFLNGECIYNGEEECDG